MHKTCVIYSVFNDAVHSSNYTVSDQGNQRTETGKDVEGNAKGLVSGTMLALVGRENLSQGKQCPGQDTNPGPPNTR
jgi:hypothetical protein